MAQLTPAQEKLWKLLGNRAIDQAGAGQRIDPTTFGRKMLQPSYVETIRKLATNSPESNHKDSASFYGKHRSSVMDYAPLTREDVPESQVSRGPEGWDTIRSAAVGEIPARMRVEQRPGSLYDRVFGAITRDKVRNAIGAVGPAGVSRTILEAFNKPDTLDAKTTNGTPRKR